MKHAIAIAIAIMTITPAHAQMLNKDTVKSDCSAEWGDEFDMVNYCIKKRTEGFHAFMKTLELAPDYMAPSMDNCLAEWGDEWEMVAYCAKKQVEAARDLGDSISGIPDDIGTKIIMNCSMNWPNDYAMINYCSKKQAEAWKSLNQ